MKRLEHLSVAALWASGLAGRLHQTDAESGAWLETCQRALKFASPDMRPGLIGALASELPNFDLTSLGHAGELGAGQTEDQETAQKCLSEPRSEPAAVTEPGSPGSAVAIPVPEPMRREWDLPPAVSGEQALSLVVALAKHSAAVEQVIWATWKRLAEDSAVRPKAQVRLLVKECLSGGPGVLPAELNESLAATISLLAHLVAAFHKAIQEHAVNFWERMSPEEIRDAAGVERRCHPWQFLVFPSKLSWRKYEQLSQNVSARSIQADLFAEIIAIVEELSQRQQAGAGPVERTPTAAMDS